MIAACVTLVVKNLLSEVVALYVILIFPCLIDEGADGGIFRWVSAVYSIVVSLGLSGTFSAFLFLSHYFFRFCPLSPFLLHLPF